jgi:hypothetical protein
VKVNLYQHKLCQAGKVRQLDEMFTGENVRQPVRNPTTGSPGRCSNNCSNVGTLLTAAIETETGRPISCGSCRSYLSALNRKPAHDHDTIVQKLYAEISWPPQWREAHGDKEGRRKRIAEIVSGVLAQATSACPTPRKGKARVPGLTRNTGRRKSGNLTTIPLFGKPINRERLQAHILYHIMPLAGSTEWVWRRHCQWLREVRHKFNGRLIIGIVTPGPGDAWSYCPPDAVKEELQGLGAEFVEAPNDTGKARHRKQVRQGKGEGVLFPRMLGMLQTLDPDHIAFYGHCKGVSRPQAAPDSPSHIWAEAMFETVFRNQKEVVEALDTHGVCGSFRMPGGYRDGGPGIGSNWFYSGTFFAARLVDVFRRNWEYIPTHYGCVEQWPRLNFERDTQAACLFFDNVHNLYDDEYWRTTINPAFEKWKAEHGTR